jgi:hypothetical protein
MESKKIFLLLCTLWTLSPLSAETALIIQPLTSDEQANALAQIEKRLGFLEEDDRLYPSYYFLAEWLREKDSEGR